MDVASSYRLSNGYERSCTVLVGGVSLIFMMSTTLRSVGMLAIILSLLGQQEQRQSLKQCLTQPWMVMILLWLAWIFCAGFWSDASASVIRSLDKKYLKLLYLPFFVVLMRQAVYRAWAMHGLIWGVVSSALISCLAYASVPGFGQLNADQIFVNHVEYAIFASVAVMLLMFQWSQVASSSKQSIAYLLGFMLLSFQLFWVNGGRMGYLIYSLSVMLSLLLWFSWQRVGWMLLALALFIILGYECSPTLHRRVFDLFYELQMVQDLHQGSNAIGARLQFHALAKQLWWNHPWMGSGIGSFSHEVVSRGLFAFMGWNQLADPHSQYWWILSEQGMIGFLFYCSFLGACIVTVAKHRQAFGIMLILFVIYGLGQCSDTLLFSTTISELFLWVMAMSLAMSTAMDQTS